MTHTYHKNNFISYLFILLSLFVLIFFSKDIVTDLYSAQQQKAQLSLEQQESRQQWEKFSNLKQELESGQAQNNVDLQKYNQDFSQHEFIGFLYGYIESSNSAGSLASIKSLSFSEAKNNEIGFHQVDINISLRVSSLATLAQMLDYFVSDGHQYKIFIPKFSYPNDGKQEPFVVQIPLQIFYK